MMERVNRILNHPRYQQCFREIQELERDRGFCRHTMEHFLDVARLTYIFALEAGVSIPREVIYAAALLHDIGRHREYTDGTPHHQAGADIAAVILPACGFTEAEQETILSAILSHRDKKSRAGLNQILYRADKMSRNCFCCDAADGCKWPDEKRNNQLNY